jgi:hypothetical protein
MESESLLVKVNFRPVYFTPDMMRPEMVKVLLGKVKCFEVTSDGLSASANDD